MATIAGCGASGGDSAVGATSEPIINGTVVATDTVGTAFLNYVNGSTSWGCSGTVINGNWPLTAHHCVTVGNASTGGTVVNPANISAWLVSGPSVTGVNIFRHPTMDVALVELGGALLNPKTGTPFTAQLYPAKAASFVGLTVLCEGWGDDTFTGSSGTLRSANLEISQMDGSDYRIVPNGSNLIEWHGDSGSSCFSGTQILGVASTCNYGSSSVNYCDQTAVENFYDWATAIMDAHTFEASDLNDALVLGSDGNLWIEDGPFGTVPPPRTQVDGNVLSFGTYGQSAYEGIYVLGSDGNLWREAANGFIPPPRTQVDGNVRSFQAMSVLSAFVLGNDGNLWLESPNGTVPPPPHASRRQRPFVPSDRLVARRCPRRKHEPVARNRAVRQGPAEPHRGRQLGERVPGAGYGTHPRLGSQREPLARRAQRLGPPSPHAGGRQREGVPRAQHVERAGARDRREPLA